MIQAVIFDFYGVLALNGWQAFKAKHFAEHGDTWKEVFDLGRMVDAGLAEYDEFVRFTAAKTGEPEAAVRHELEHTLANDELLEYIRTELRPHYKLGILSNASHNVAEKIFTPEQLGLFDEVVLSHHVGLTKPHLEMYNHIVKLLDVPAGACLFVDDQERHIVGARAAGMRAVLYHGMAKFKREIVQAV